MFVQLTTRNENIVPELRRILLGQVTSTTDFDSARVAVGATVVAMGHAGLPEWTEIWADHATLPTNCVLRSPLLAGGGYKYLRIRHGSTTLSYSGQPGPSGWWGSGCSTIGTTPVSGLYFEVGTDYVDGAITPTVVVVKAPLTYRTGSTPEWNVCGDYPDLFVPVGEPITVSASTHALLVTSMQTTVSYQCFYGIYGYNNRFWWEARWQYFYFPASVVAIVDVPTLGPSAVVVSATSSLATATTTTASTTYQPPIVWVVNELVQVPITFRNMAPPLEFSPLVGLWQTNSGNWDANYLVTEPTGERWRVVCPYSTALAGTDRYLLRE